MAIILPAGTVDAWQAAHADGTIGAWVDLDNALQRHANAECDFTLRDDYLTLADVAWAHAMDSDKQNAAGLARS